MRTQVLRRDSSLIETQVRHILMPYLLIFLYKVVKCMPNWFAASVAEALFLRAFTICSRSVVSKGWMMAVSGRLFSESSSYSCHQVIRQLSQCYLSVLRSPHSS